MKLIKGQKITVEEKQKRAERAKERARLFASIASQAQANRDKFRPV